MGMHIGTTVVIIVRTRYFLIGKMSYAFGTTMLRR